MEGFTLETKLARGNKEAPLWLSSPQSEHVWIPCQQIHDATDIAAMEGYD